MKTILFILSFSLFSCATKQTETMQNKTVNYLWHLSHMNNEKVAFETTLKITDTHFSGKAACNNYSGNTVRNGAQKIAFPSILSTRMACLKLNKEQAYFSVLKSVVSYKMEGNILSLADETGQTVLVFTK